MDANRHE
jgi:hypothetical protein